MLGMRNHWRRAADNLLFALGWGGFVFTSKSFSIVGRLPFPKWRLFCFPLPARRLFRFFGLQYCKRLLPIEIPSFSNTTDAVVAGTASSHLEPLLYFLLSAFF